jgi:hypothetical protein
MDLFDRVLDLLFPNRHKELLTRIHEARGKIDRAHRELRELCDRQEYFTKHQFNAWKVRWGGLAELLRSYPRVRRKLDGPLNGELHSLHSAVYDSTFLSKRNEDYVRNEVQRNRDHFSKLEKYPLTPLQCQAIVTDESRTLVVAGAGTGKTSTLVGKAAYVLRRGFAKPDEILLLSFRRRSAGG